MKDKEFGISSWALRNKTSVYIIMVIIIFTGLSSYINMPKELFPEIKIPTIYVNTIYPGNSPLDIENLITRPLEKEIKSVNGIKNMKSTSVQDNSIIIVEFYTDVEVSEALSDVKDAVDKAKRELPNDLDLDPIVLDIDFSEFPIMNINLSGDYSIDELKDYAEYLQDEIEDITAIRRADIKGALPREISIMVDLHKLEAVKLSLGDLENAIASENVSISGGDILVGGFRRSVRVIGEFKRVSDIENIIVKHEKGNIVYLRDIATVEDGYAERQSYARLDKYPVVSLDVIKKGGENLLDATDKIMDILEKAKKERFPDDLKIAITNDQSEQTRDQINNLENSIIMGVIFVVLVLLFFLGLRNAIFVGVAIPISMFLSFAILGFMGVTLNLMVLFSLILALGMLVDNAIVVVENIYRLFEQGKSPEDASRIGVGEIAVPIISSTATTLAAFFPLLFWKDIMGEFMKYLPMTLIIVLASSLFVALIVNPVLIATMIKKDEQNKTVNHKKQWTITGIMTIVGIFFILIGKNALGGLIITFALLGLINVYFFTPATNWFQNVFLTKLELLYESTLTYFLSGKKPYLLILIFMPVLLVMSISIYFGSNPKVEFFPNTDPKYINVFVETPIGTDIVETDELAKKIENEIFELTQPFEHIISSIVTNVGEGTSDPNEGPSQGKTPNKARITISFVEFKLREGLSSSDVMKVLSSKLSDYPGVIIAVDKNNDGPPVGKPINIEVSGEDFEQLLEVSKSIENEINAANVPGVEGIKLDLEVTKPEMTVNIDRAKARTLGLSTAQIGMALRNALFGKEVSKYKEGEDDYPIMVRLKDNHRYDEAALMNQRITFRDQMTGQINQIPLSSVTNVSYGNSYGSIKRKDMKRVITVFSNVIEGYNPTEVNNSLKKLLEKKKLPDGYEYKFTGEQEEQEKSMKFLTNALLIAVSLITLILVSQFNSVIKPFIIVVSVLFSTIGVFLGLAIFQMSFVVIMTGIGIVSLAGIVVNNAIVLIDYIDLLRSQKRAELGISDKEMLPWNTTIQTIIEGGKTRLRPVLLTAITTVLGLIPLATGLNFDFFGLFNSFEPDIYTGGDNVAFWGPMSWTIIFGLTFATFLTLIAVPAMYLMSDKIIRKVKGIKN
jgi:multidrug efflux pump